MNRLKEATKIWTDNDNGVFINDFCIFVLTHSLKQKEYNGLEGYIVGFSKDDRVSFHIGEPFCDSTKIIAIKLENITVLEN